ncbi:rCG38088 [Rattus norvegicus]|uniref:RCG38088 n=1 Tax=Rattus norvegicus TaxID=10116 RepID=A6IV32_RAT|nr:rCG38088 [Rattus norvegicus]
MASVDPGANLQAGLNRFRTKIGTWPGRLAFHKVLFTPMAKANAAGWG